MCSEFLHYLFFRIFLYLSSFLSTVLCVCVCVWRVLRRPFCHVPISLSLSLSLLVIFKGGSFGPAVQRSIILTAPAARAAFLTSCYKFVFFFFFSKEVEEVVACVCKQTTAVDVERTVLVKKVPGQQNKKKRLCFRWPNASHV